MVAWARQRATAAMLREGERLGLELPFWEKVHCRKCRQLELVSGSIPLHPPSVSLLCRIPWVRRVNSCVSGTLQACDTIDENGSRLLSAPTGSGSR
jgi:hypothetical protein